MGREIIIHLGMPKTGTTTLQNRVFQHHNGYLYLGKFNPDFTPDAEDRDRWLLSLKQDLVCKEIPFFKMFDFERELRERFGEEYERHDKLFLSEESIMGRCLGPGKYGNILRISSIYHTLYKLQTIFEYSSFSAVKIVLVLRKQDDLIESFFAEEYQRFRSFFGMQSPSELVDYLLTEGRLEEIDSVLRYHSLVRHIDTLFGIENVLVLLYENLKTHPDSFMVQLSTFMKIKPWENTGILKETRDNNRNSGKRKGKIAKTDSIKLKMNRLKQRIFGDISTGLGRHLDIFEKFRSDTVIRLDRDSREKILQNYREENSRLQGRVNHLLESGYI